MAHSVGNPRARAATPEQVAHVQPPARSVYIRHVVATLKATGVSANDLLAGTGISEHELTDVDRRIGYEQQLEVYARAVALYPGDDLGVALGLRQRAGDHGVFGYALQSSANLGQALRIMVQFLSVIGPLACIEPTKEGPHTVLTLCEVTPLGKVKPVAYDETLTAIATQLLVLTEPKTTPVSVSLDYVGPASKALQQLFGCTITLGADATRIVLATEHLTRPLRMADSEMALICEAKCRELASFLSASDDTITKVQRILVRDPRDRATLDSVAAQLNISGRSLRRRLQQSGTTFGAIRDQIRKEIAIDYLVHSNLHLDEIADLLGYLDTPNFHRAFKRWTGASPGAFRRKHSVWA